MAKIYYFRGNGIISLDSVQREFTSDKPIIFG